MRAALGVCALAVLAALPAAAQERSPAERQGLLDLARVLGESHALEQVCEAASAQLWRDRMADLLRVEAADRAFDVQLTKAFNSGYAAGTALYPRCSAPARVESARLAAQGRSLSERLAGG